jgi:hypothetical protein
MKSGQIYQTTPGQGAPRVAWQLVGPGRLAIFIALVGPDASVMSVQSARMHSEIAVIPASTWA